MVVTQVDDVAACTHVIVQANRSMSWRGNLLVLAVLALTVVGIAVAFATFGLWLVLPFAGLEVLLVGGGLYWTLRRLERREVITISEREVRLARGSRRPEFTRSLPRAWVRLEFEYSDSPFDAGRLALCVHAQRYAIGDCLGREEKRQLARELSRLLGAAGQ